MIALPGVDGLNAVEHLRTLFPETRIIWCSELDFSLHAFRLRMDNLLLEPMTEEDCKRKTRSSGRLYILNCYESLHLYS